METLDYEERQKQIETHWNNFAEAYEKEADQATVQTAVQLYNMTKASHADRILEVAAGTGRSSRTFVASFMKPGSL